MNAFFTIAGIVVTIVGLACFAIITYVYISVKFFGAELDFNSGKNKKKENNDTEL